MASGRLARIPGLTAFSSQGGVATITMDDGKVNALSPAMFEELFAALDRAEAEEAIVILTGRDRILSGGFDLRCPPERLREMVAGGARLAERLLSFPNPVVAACNGNAIAMAAFMLLCCDHRTGVEGDFRIGLNEVAIGLTPPWFGIAVARHRLSPPYFDRCAVSGAMLDPDESVTAGFLDLLTAPEQLPEAGRHAAEQLGEIDRAAHRATKLRVRAQAIEGVREGIARIENSDGDW